MTPADRDPERPWLIDGRPLIGHSGVRGIGTYLRELLLAWDRLGVSSRAMLLHDRGGDDEATAVPSGVQRGPGIPAVSRRFQPLADPFLVSAAVRRVRPALYHGIEWAQPILPFGVPVVLTIHDLIPFLFPAQFHWNRRARLPALRLARYAGAVIVPSRATGDDVERLGRVDPRRIHIIPHGVAAGHVPAPPDAIAALRTRLGLGDRRYLLAVGTLDAHKRRDELAEVVARVRAEHDVALVITGDQGIFGPLLQGALGKFGVAGATIQVGYTAPADLIALYSGASTLIFPSAYEGFGLPVLEALACGTRVVCFDNSALPEVAGDAADLVRDGDVAAMAHAVGAVLSEGADVRSDRVERGRKRAATFTWERSARAHLDVYAEVERGTRATVRAAGLDPPDRGREPGPATHDHGVLAPGVGLSDETRRPGSPGLHLPPWARGSARVGHGPAGPGPAGPGTGRPAQREPRLPGS